MVSRSVADMLTLLRFIGSVLVRRFSSRAVLEPAVRDRPLAPGLHLRGIILPASRPRLLDFLMTSICPSPSRQTQRARTLQMYEFSASEKRCGGCCSGNTFVVRFCSGRSGRFPLPSLQPPLGLSRSGRVAPAISQCPSESAPALRR